MTGVVQRFDTQPMLQHLRGLERLNNSHFISVRREIGEYMLGNVQDNLDTQRLADGKAMPPSKAADKRGGKTLIKTHRLYDSYAYQLRDAGVEIGSAAIYSAIHHFGGTTGRGGKTKITPRPVLGVSSKQERAIGDYMIAAIGRLP